jgi:hypothetical protein
MQPSFQITTRRFVLLWASTGLAVLAVAALIGHLLGPHPHGHISDVAAIADHQVDHQVDHDPTGLADDREMVCGYLVQAESGGQPVADPTTSASTVSAAHQDRGVASVGSPQDSRAPPDLMSELQVIRI